MLTGHVAFWYTYILAFARGMVWLISRPAYKVSPTKAVPYDEVQSAVAINSMTETADGTLINAGGSQLLAAVGLPIAFVLNAVSYFQERWVTIARGVGGLTGTRTSWSGAHAQEAALRSV